MLVHVANSAPFEGLNYVKGVQSIDDRIAARMLAAGFAKAVKDLYAIVDNLGITDFVPEFGQEYLSNLSDARSEIIAADFLTLYNKFNDLGIVLKYLQSINFKGILNLPVGVFDIKTDPVFSNVVGIIKGLFFPEILLKGVGNSSEVRFVSDKPGYISVVGCHFELINLKLSSLSSDGVKMINWGVSAALQADNCIFEFDTINIVMSGMWRGDGSTYNIKTSITVQYHANLHADYSIINHISSVFGFFSGGIVEIVEHSNASLEGTIINQTVAGVGQGLVVNSASFAQFIDGSINGFSAVSKLENGVVVSMLGVVMGDGFSVANCTNKMNVTSGVLSVSGVVQA